MWSSTAQNDDGSMDERILMRNVLVRVCEEAGKREKNDCVQSGSTNGLETKRRLWKTKTGGIEGGRGRRPAIERGRAGMQNRHRTFLSLGLQSFSQERREKVWLGVRSWENATN